MSMLPYSRWQPIIVEYFDEFSSLIGCRRKEGKIDVEVDYQICSFLLQSPNALTVSLYNLSKNELEVNTEFSSGARF